MVNCWGAEEIRACVSRNDQSSWTANSMKLETMHIWQAHVQYVAVLGLPHQETKRELVMHQKDS